MAQLRFQNAQYPLESGESVLDCLLRNQQQVSYSCKSGLCQSCLVQAVDCQPPSRAIQGLKTTLQSTGHALACQWMPDNDGGVRLPDDTMLSINACIKRPQSGTHVEMGYPGVIRVILEEDKGQGPPS